MNVEILKQVTWIGDELVQEPIRGVVLAFHGLGFGGLKAGPSTEELAWASAGGLVVFPYYGPWSWMNRQARAFVDELVDALFVRHSLPASTPIICTGGSMGGCSSLLYARYARRPVAACLANCPVCDVKYHFSERPDLPPTFHHAFWGYGDLEAAFVEQSPLCQVERMPDIPYLLIHGEKDSAVSKTKHSDRMVAAMRQRGLNVKYIEVAGMGHCGPLPIEVMQETIEFVAGAVQE